jgi:hypothetical protein
MGHTVYDVKDTLKSYRLAAEQFLTPFYTNTIKHYRFFHIPRLLHFSENMKQADKNESNYDRFWKMRTLFDQLNDTCAKFYSLSEHLATKLLCSSQKKLFSNMETSV